MAVLLGRLREVGAEEQVTALAGRAARTPLDQPYDVATLLDQLKAAGSPDVAVLVARLPGAGMFGEFLARGEHGDRFHFGREPDGASAAAWAWLDLD